jgi:hypothetical protein
MGKSLEKVKTELEIEEHLDAHKRGFIVQKIGMIMLLVIVALGAIGFFGDGLVSTESVTLPSCVVEFQKFHRHEARMKLSISVLRKEEDKITVSFPSAYLKSLEIETITPDASNIELRGDRVDYTFSGNGFGTTINFSIVPRKMGSLKGEIQVNGAPVHLTHFIYP